jgi:hypothetical protein
MALHGGAVLPDRDLGGFGWETATEPTLGLEATWGRGGWETGLRSWGWSGTQRTASDAVAARVAGLAVLAGRRLAGGDGGGLWLTGNLGGVRLSYHPETLRLDFPGFDPVSVSLKTVHDWTVGAALGLRRELGRGFGVGGEIEHQVFFLTTAHRAGEDVVEERRSFGQWGARLRVSYTLRS